MDPRGIDKDRSNTSAWAHFLAKIFPALWGGAAYTVATGSRPEDILPTPIPHKPITIYGGEEGVPIGPIPESYAVERGNPEILNVAPTPKDMPVHETKVPNRNGPEYIRKIGEDKVPVSEGDVVLENILKEIGDFNMFNEETPVDSLENTEIPY